MEETIISSCNFQIYQIFPGDWFHIFSMVNLKVPCRPIIAYRPVHPSDLAVLEKIHGKLFPIRSEWYLWSLEKSLDGHSISLRTIWWSFRYETEFFHNVVNGNGIVSWAAVDRSRPDEQSDELIGFVTARVVSAKESEVSVDSIWLSLNIYAHTL